MTLEYSNISEVFPNFSYTQKHDFLYSPNEINQEPVNNKKAFINQDDPPSYEKEISPLSDIKVFQKLRIVNNQLQIDTRRFQCISRKLSGDNRWKILEKLKELPNDIQNNVINTLVNTTYYKDKKWVTKAKELKVKYTSEIGCANDFILDVHPILKKLE